MLVGSHTWRHLRLISANWAGSAVRSGSGLVFLLIALVFGLSVAHLVLSPVEMLMRQERSQGRQVSRAEVVERIVEAGRPVVRWSLGVKTEVQEAETSPAAPDPFGRSAAVRRDPWSSFLLDERPALLSVIFLILLFGMPFVISFLAFNQFSGDVQSRGLRYLLLRTERGNIYWGRFLGTALFSTAVMAILIGTIALYAGAKIHIYSAGAMALWSVHGFAALAVLMLPYLAVCTWVSAMIDAPFASLVVAKLVIAGVLVFALVGKLAWGPAVYFKYALPWGVQNHLLHPEWSHVLGAVAACLGYAGVFLMLGHRHFVRRDL